MPPATPFVVVYVERDADHYEELRRARGGPRAKAVILVPDLKRYYLAAPRHSDQIAAVKVSEVE